jgi:molybdopterin-guanine dinucleotide biosynthesis protein A
VRGAILAGGGATRFGGRPKGLEAVGGERILDRLVRCFADALGTPPLLVANDADAPAWRDDLRVTADIQPGHGSLGGILTAVAVAPAPVVCVAWDMPFVPATLVRALAAGLDGADVCIPASDSRRGLEPLCAAYGPACRAAIEERVAAGDLRAVGFHQAVRVHILPLDTVRALGDPAELFFNVNTAEDLALAEEIWRNRASSRSSDERTPGRPR